MEEVDGGKNRIFEVKTKGETAGGEILDIGSAKKILLAGFRFDEEAEEIGRRARFELINSGNKIGGTFCE